jgi:hypothetical protein
VVAVDNSDFEEEDNPKKGEKPLDYLDFKLYF